MIQILFNIVVQERRSSRPHGFFSSQPSQRSKDRGRRHKLDRRWTIKPGELPSSGVWQPCSPWSDYVLPHAQFEERQVTFYPPSFLYYALQFHQGLDTYLQELETNNASSNTQVHTDPQPKLLGGFPDRPGRLPLTHLPGDKSPWKPQTGTVLWIWRQNIRSTLLSPGPAAAKWGRIGPPLELNPGRLLLQVVLLLLLQVLHTSSSPLA